MSAAPNRPNRRSAKGQAMAIFALVSVLLFVVAGLSIDAGTSYLTSNKIERAAAAAALAGVAYLPGDIPDAQNAALVEAARDGFPNAGAANLRGNPSPCVVTSEPTTNELKVTISATVGTIFLRIVGFGSHTVVRSETAQYLPPISLGQPGGQQGSALSDPSCNGLPNYCASTASGLGSGGNNYYFERQEGWGNPRSEGDPFTPSAAQSEQRLRSHRHRLMQRVVRPRLSRDQHRSGHRASCRRNPQLRRWFELSDHHSQRSDRRTRRSSTPRSRRTPAVVARRPSTATTRTTEASRAPAHRTRRTRRWSTRCIRCRRSPREPAIPR